MPETAGTASVQQGVPPISWRRRITNHVMTGAALSRAVSTIAELGVADSYRQRRIDLFARFGGLSIGVQSPGIGV